jgi:hypothetical protein
MPLRYVGPTVPLKLPIQLCLWQAYTMRPLRYSINVTLDGCCDHRAIPADEELHRYAAANLDQADALLFGRVTYEMMEAAFRLLTPARARPDWTDAFARTIDAAKKYVVSSTLDRVERFKDKRHFSYVVRTQREPIATDMWQPWQTSTSALPAAFKAC